MIIGRDMLVASLGVSSEAASTLPGPTTGRHRSISTGLSPSPPFLRKDDNDGTIGSAIVNG